MGSLWCLRYADDAVFGFEREADARRFLEAMRERLAQFALKLHPDKTRLIEFGRHAATKRKRRGLGKPETFDFLGFTFICGKSRKGGFALKRKSRGDRMRAKLKAIKDGLKARMHQPIPVQGQWLGRVVAGWFNYHAVPTNFRALDTTSSTSGDVRSGGAVRRTARRGRGPMRSQTSGSPNRASFTHGLNSGLPSNTQGGSRMP